MLSFEELTESRRFLQSFCLLHVPSLLAVQSGISFKLFPSEDRNLDDGELHHPTTSATCLTSLFDCPSRYRSADFARAEDVKSKFAAAALHREDWTSDGSADVYCRCRALPMVIKASKTFEQEIEGHIGVIIDQLKQKPKRFGIGEAAPGTNADKWYPPNAFNTYWTLRIVDLLKRTFPTEYKRLAAANSLNLEAHGEGMLLWARQQLGYQIGLHSGSPPSSLLDSDQLAWSLAIFLRFDKSLNLDLENRDFVKQALKCLFSTQTDGTWRHYKPLFHYEKAGNAYCYVFETFEVLLRCALQPRAEAEMIRELLKPYCRNLIDLWRYADSTKIDLRQYIGSQKQTESSIAPNVGWCSGHRTNVTEPESWATASVFSYAQALRRLIGIWCREQALGGLNVPRGRLRAKEATEKIESRGKTWGAGKITVSERLWTLLINPVKMHLCDDRLEPDSQPIAENHARSAILFGPPGTSKTSLVRALADVVNWKYIELHASHFVAEGLTQVQKTADLIFRQLAELDHAVVLFDEIDELVRERDMEKDAFGRFLTTSMLPKLAELWAARKILYFVATNHINYFDNAVIRSNRFDALILVSPPSFESKIQRLTKLLSDVYGFPGMSFQIEESQVQTELSEMDRDLEALRKPDGSVSSNETEETRVLHWREHKLSPTRALAKFALLRYDELDELAFRLAGILKATSPRTNSVPKNDFESALMRIDDSEWRKNKSYVDFLRDGRSERRDYQMLNVWQVAKESALVVPELVGANGSEWLCKAVDTPQEIQLAGLELHFHSPGLVKISSSNSK
jgi:hypothetical protein